MGRPIITTLCGSTRFPTAFELAEMHLGTLGVVVLSVAVRSRRPGMTPDAEMADLLVWAAVLMSALTASVVVWFAVRFLVVLALGVLLRTGVVK